MSNIISAAGVIILQQDTAEENFKVLLLKRNPALKVHGGNWVFPGGKFDAQDFAVIKRNPIEIDIKNPPELSAEDLLQVATEAACRETLEEAGITLTHPALKLHSRWLSPAKLSKRFDTHFFTTLLPALPSDGINPTQVIVDGSEIIDFQWISPASAIVRLNENQLPMPPATYVTLVKLAQYQQAEQAIEALCRKPVYYRPKLMSTEDGLCSLYEEDSGYLTENHHANDKLHRLKINAGKYEYISNIVPERKVGRSEVDPSAQD